MIVPLRRALSIASLATAGVVSESAQKMPPVMKTSGSLLFEDQLPIDLSRL
jgi:hypothetical protein